MRSDFPDEFDDLQRLRPPAEFLERFSSDREGLFDALRALVSDRMLRTIAGSDYGQDVEMHYAALRRLRAGEHLNEPTDYAPHEVLSLFRWSEEALPREGLSDPQDFHLARAFCAAALLRMPEIFEERPNFDNDVLIPLIESCLNLGKSFVRPLLRQISWGLQTMDPWDEEYLFHAFGFLAVGVIGREFDAAEADRLGEWFVLANGEIMPWHSAFSPGATTFMQFRHGSISLQRWQRSIDLTIKAAPKGSSLGERLRSLFPDVSGR